MGSNLNRAYISYNVFSKNDKFVYQGITRQFNYLYPNCHRITHQMRWSQDIRDRDLETT